MPGYNIITLWHNNGSLKQKLFPFSFNGFFIATLEPLSFKTQQLSHGHKKLIHGNFMVYSWNFHGD